MRLIDIEDASLVKEVSAGGLSAKALWRLINRQSTIKAIPKEWIRDYMRRLPNGSEAYECILVMLEDWEKEND